MFMRCWCLVFSSEIHFCSISNRFMKHFLRNKFQIWLETQPYDWIWASSFFTLLFMFAFNFKYFLCNFLIVAWWIKICLTRVFKCVTRVPSIFTFLSIKCFSVLTAFHCRNYSDWQVLMMSYLFHWYLPSEEKMFLLTGYVCHISKCYIILLLQTLNQRTGIRFCLS